MKYLLTILALALAAGAMAADLDAMRPDKPAVQVAAPPVDPGLTRQGGDTIVDATPITVPYTGSGTTVGYNDDYDEACPYDGSTSPDVVYSFVPAATMTMEFDLYGSLYDTKIYVYDEALNLVACNDDFYPDYVSKLENVSVEAGVTYFVIVDGYGGDAGEYTLAIEEYEPCNLDIPAGAVIENEPTLEDGYVDCYNNGCSGECDTPFVDDMQPLLGGDDGTMVFHGISGWYVSPEGGQVRDTDWFQAVVGPGGVVEATIDAEFPVYLFELGPQDCASVGVVQNVIGGPCLPNAMTVAGEPGSTIWLWVGPTTFEGPVNEYDYLLTVSGLQPGPVATESHSWSGVKSLFH